MLRIAVSEILPESSDRIARRFGYAASEAWRITMQA